MEIYRRNPLTYKTPGSLVPTWSRLVMHSVAARSFRQRLADFRLNLSYFKLTSSFDMPLLVIMHPRKVELVTTSKSCSAGLTNVALPQLCMRNGHPHPFGANIRTQQIIVRKAHALDNFPLPAEASAWVTARLPTQMPVTLTSLETYQARRSAR